MKKQKKKRKYLTNGPNDARPSFGPFSLFVGFLFPLRWPLLVLWAFVGPRGCRPRQRGVWWVWCSWLSCTVKKTQPPASGGYARVGLLTRVCTGQVCTGRGYRQAYPHPYPPVPVPVTLGVWPDPCLSLFGNLHRWNHDNFTQYSEQAIQIIRQINF